MIYIKNRFKKNNLLNNYEQTSGYIIKINPGVKTGGGVQFKYSNKSTKYNLLMPSSSGCKKMINKNLTKLRKLVFPIVYHPKDIMNAEILLFESQYIKYKVEIPKDLKEIVEMLSDCEK